MLSARLNVEKTMRENRSTSAREPVRPFGADRRVIPCGRLPSMSTMSRGPYEMSMRPSVDAAASSDADEGTWFFVDKVQEK